MVRRANIAAALARIAESKNLTPVALAGGSPCLARAAGSLTGHPARSPARTLR